MAITGGPKVAGEITQILAGGLPANRVSRSCLQLGAKLSDEVGPHQPQDVSISADQRDLRDDAPDPPINRRHDQGVTTTVARSPDADMVAIDFGSVRAYCAPKPTTLRSRRSIV